MIGIGVLHGVLHEHRMTLRIGVAILVMTIIFILMPLWTALVAIGLRVLLLLVLWAISYVNKRSHG